AGHCGTLGTRATGGVGAGGQFRYSRFPGNDWAWVQAGSGWTVSPRVSPSAQVADGTEAPVGASVCRSGSTTGWHCGTISAKNQSVTYPQGTVTGMTRTTVCAEPGGSYISGGSAQGMTSGGSGTCSSGGATFFEPLTRALANTGTTLTTADSDPGDPGTWSTGASYSIGDEVTYGGGAYRCRIAHTAHTGWEPSNTPALWLRVG
ncbi:MAG: carbohydrate-binding protein, partial [Stackebrandtia sp.]